MKSKLACFCALTAVALVSFMLAMPMAQETAPKANISPKDSVRAQLRGNAAAILKNRCATSGCHIGTRPKMRLTLAPAAALDTLTNRPSHQVDTLMLVDTKRPDRSYILMKVRGDKAIRGGRMPDDAPRLKGEEIKTIELWIESLSTRTR
jgi:hypothetical protein